VRNGIPESPEEPDEHEPPRRPLRGRAVIRRGDAVVAKTRRRRRVLTPRSTMATDLGRPAWVPPFSSRGCLPLGHSLAAQGIWPALRSHPDRRRQLATVRAGDRSAFSGGARLGDRQRATPRHDRTRAPAVSDRRNNCLDIRDGEDTVSVQLLLQRDQKANRVSRRPHGTFGGDDALHNQGNEERDRLPLRQLPTDVAHELPESMRAEGGVRAPGRDVGEGLREYRVHFAGLVGDENGPPARRGRRRVPAYRLECGILP
jgi:hypothetical protein